MDPESEQLERAGLQAIEDDKIVARNLAEVERTKTEAERAVVEERLKDFVNRESPSETSLESRLKNFVNRESVVSEPKAESLGPVPTPPVEVIVPTEKEESVVEPVVPKTEVSSSPSVVELQDQVAKLKAELANARSEKKQRVLKEIRAERAEKFKGVKELVMGAVDALDLALDKGGREVIRGEIDAVVDEAVTDVVEVAKTAVAEGEKALRWVDEKGSQLEEVVKAGKKDVREYVETKVKKPLLKVKAMERLGRELVGGAYVGLKEIEGDVHTQVEKVSGFIFNMAEVAKGFNRVLTEHHFTPLAEKITEQLADESRRKAREAAEKARRCYDAKQQLEEWSHQAGEYLKAEEQKVQEREENAKRFPNFVSRLKRLVS